MRAMCLKMFTQEEGTETRGRFLSGGIILGFPHSCTDLFLYTITLPAVNSDALPTLSYTTLELASRVLLSSKKPALGRGVPSGHNSTPSKQENHE